MRTGRAASHRYVRLLATALYGLLLGGAEVAHADAAEPIRCPGSPVIDGHTGARVCSPGATGVTPWAPAPTEPAGTSDARGHASDVAQPSDRREPGGDLAVEAEAPVFENGDVPGALGALTRMKREIARCLDEPGDHPMSRAPLPRARAANKPIGEQLREDERERPQSAAAGAARVPGLAGVIAVDARALPRTLHLTFLVRAPGRAEGVNVARSAGAPDELRRCVASRISGKAVGTPSSDAVGVSVTFRLRRVKKQ